MFSPKTPISLKSLAQKSLQDLHDSGANLPFQPSPHPKMPDISIAAEGIDKLLKGLSPHNAAGPDKFKPIVLQTLHKELAPILQLIFQRSIDTGKIPDIWKDANVSPIYKKAINLTHPTTGQSHWLVSCAKFWSILLLLAWLNTSLNWTYFTKCSMASEKRDPVRRNL